MENTHKLFVQTRRGQELLTRVKRFVKQHILPAEKVNICEQHVFMFKDYGITSVVSASRSTMVSHLCSQSLTRCVPDLSTEPLQNLILKNPKLLKYAKGMLQINLWD